MKKFLVILVLVPFLVTGCASISSLFHGGGPTVDRVLADAGCLASLVGAGIAVAGDPMLGGAASILDVLAAIEHVGVSTIPSSVLSACAASLAYITQDAKGAAAIVAAAASTSPPVVPGAKKVGAKKPVMKVGLAADVSKAPSLPTVVTIPLPSK